MVIIIVVAVVIYKYRWSQLIRNKLTLKKKKEQKYFFFESWLSTGHWEEKNVDRFIPRSNFKEGGSVKALIRKK